MLILASVEPKGPIDGWLFWIAGMIAALAIIWRSTRPLRDIGIRNRNIHDAVLGTPARVDKRTGTILQEAQPGLVTSLRELTSTIAATTIANDSIRKLSESAVAVASQASVTAGQAADAAFSTQRALEAHERACAALEGKAMWNAIEEIAKDGQPGDIGSST